MPIYEEIRNFGIIDVCLGVKNVLLAKMSITPKILSRIIPPGWKYVVYTYDIIHAKF